MSLKDVLFVEKLPNDPELEPEKIWIYVSSKPKVQKFFPSYQNYEYPDKNYLINVLNTIYPHSMEHLIKKVQKIS